MMDLTRTAVIIIDMQLDFVGEAAVIPCKGSENIIPNIKKLTDFCHRNRIPVIYTQEAHRANYIDFGRELDGDEPVHCLEGSRGIEIIPELAPASRDYVIMKRRYSGFFQTDLQILLSGLKVDTLVITGAATDVCVRATATDAQQYGYYVYVPRDCVAGTTPARHEAALENIRYLFGKVINLSDILEIA
jgi:nicotinamidase-related amidase